jgi:hypothetical protein
MNWGNVSNLRSNETGNTYVVEISRGSHRSAKLEGQSPVARAGGLVNGHLIALPVLVPRAGYVAALDVRGGAESKCGSGGGGRHDDRG